MADFCMLDHIDKLTSVKGGKFTCPACNGTNFSVDKTTGAYDCYDGCESRDIREAVAPWENRDRTQATPKAARPAQKRQWTYTDVEGNPCIQVNRADDGNGKKQIYQAFWESNQWITKVSDETKAKLKKSVTIYRVAEILKAIEAGQAIFWVEGEPCADLLWDLGIPATTSIGGSAAYKSNGDYSQVLTGASVVICPDRDVNGLKYADLVAADYPESKWLYAFPDSPAWENLPRDKGLDIVDWVSDFKLDSPQIVRAVEERRKASSPFILLDGGKTAPKVSRTLKSDILTAMDEGLSGSDLEARKLQVASANGIPAQALGILWRQIEKEIEQQDGRSAQSEEIESLLLKKAQRLDISRILPESLAGPLKRRAELLGSTPEILLTTLLPVVASQAKIGTKLHLSRGSEWEALPIFWSGIVGEPATAKSPSLNVFFKPLRAIQGRAIDRYKEEMKYFEKLEERGEDVPEKALRYLVDDVTIESLARIQDEQPDHGCLIGVDELAGFVNSLGQYKGGKGSDKQKVLGIRDGKGFSVSRAGKDDIMTSSSSFSICGAIQPGVLAQQMGDFTDTDGYWSRFCWCLLPLLRKQLETPEKDAAIAQKLRHDIEFILATVKSFHPLGYELSPDAKASCEAFREEMEDRRMDHPNNTMKIVHGKVQGQVGEVALILHLLWGTGGRGSIPDIFVSDQTMQRAIEVMRFFIVQAELIQALGEEVQGGEISIYTKMIELSHKKGWVKASDASKSVRAIKDDKQKDGNYVRVLFLELEAMGKGEIKGKGRSLEFKAFTGAKVSIDESPLSYPGWTLTDIQELRDALKTNPDASEALRAIVPPELWPQVGIAA